METKFLVVSMLYGIQKQKCGDVHVKLIVYNVILLPQEVFLKKREVICVEIS